MIIYSSASCTGTCTEWGGGQKLLAQCSELKLWKSLTVRMPSRLKGDGTLDRGCGPGASCAALSQPVSAGAVSVGAQGPAAHRTNQRKRREEATGTSGHSCSPRGRVATRPKQLPPQAAPAHKGLPLSRPQTILLSDKAKSNLDGDNRCHIKTLDFSALGHGLVAVERPTSVSWGSALPGGTGG